MMMLITPSDVQGAERWYKKVKIMQERILKLQVESGSNLPNPQAVIKIKGEDILVVDVIKLLKEKYGPDISEERDVRKMELPCEFAGVGIGENEDIQIMCLHPHSTHEICDSETCPMGG